MPNYCFNQININGKQEDITAFLNKIESDALDRGVERGFFDEAVFTFATFVPAPDNVLTGNTGHGTFVRDGDSWVMSGKTRDQLDAEGVEYYYGSYGTSADGTVYFADDMKRLGLVDWYSWNIDNWGTKWDAFDVEIDRHDDYVSIHFHTAWSPAVPVALAMQEQHPELDIQMYFEEPGMSFQGEVTSDGNVYYEDYEDLEEEEEEVYG